MNKFQSIYGFVNDKLINRRVDILIYWGPPVLVLLYNMLFFNKYFPLTEGWWETFGYLVNRGLVPYKDFNVALPINLIELHALYLKYISNNFACLRFLGVILFCLNVFLLQRLLDVFFSRKIAATAATFAAFLSMSGPTFIAKDYHTYVDLFVGLSLFIGQLYIKSIDRSVVSKYVSKYKSNIILLLLGMLLALLTNIKQNIGIFLFLSYCFSVVLVLNSDTKKRIKAAMILIVGYVFALSLYVIYIGLGNYNKLFFANDAKGSMFGFVTRFISCSHNVKPLLTSILLFCIYLIITRSPDYLRKKVRCFLLSDKYAALINFSAIIILMLNSVFMLKSNGASFYSGVIPICLTGLWIILIRTHFLTSPDSNNMHLKFIILPLIALAYCNTQTASFNFTGMFFPIAFTTALIIDRISINTTVKAVYLHIVFLTVIPFLVFDKLQFPYEWWSLKQGKISSARYELNYPSTKGIYVDLTTKEAFDLISSAINKYSNSDNDVYLFPDIPIFYYLHNKIPPYKNPVQWFDAIGTKDIELEKRQFVAHPPNLIIFLEPPIEVYAGHIQLLKRPLVQLEIVAELEKLVEKGDYQLVDYYILCQDNTLLSNNQIVVTNFNIIGHKLSYISSMYPKDDFIITGIVRDGVRLSNLNPDIVVKRGDLLEIDGVMKTIKLLAEGVGVLKNSKYYSIKIYAKKTDPFARKRT